MAYRQRASHLLRGTRPRQWFKNGLVPLGALAGDGVIDVPELVAATAALTAAAAAVYLYNDVKDVDLDRMDPWKAGRPVASGDLPMEVARLCALLIGAGAVVLGMFTGAPWVVPAYLALNLAYSSGWKALPWLEMLPVVAGFPLRVVAGAATGGRPADALGLSLVVAAAASGAVLAKRGGELHEGCGGRPAARNYRPGLLSALRRSSFMAAVLLQAVSDPVAAAGLAVAAARLELRAAEGGAARPDRLLAEDPLALTGAGVWAFRLVT